MRAVGFSIESGTPTNRKEAISKIDHVTQVLPNQVSIICKDLRLIPFQHKASQVRDSPLIYKLTNIPNVVKRHLQPKVAHYQGTRRRRLQHMVSLEIVGSHP